VASQRDVFNLCNHVFRVEWVQNSLQMHYMSTLFDAILSCSFCIYRGYMCTQRKFTIKCTKLPMILSQTLRTPHQISWVFPLSFWLSRMYDLFIEEHTQHILQLIVMLPLRIGAIDHGHKVSVFSGVINFNS
jgi:hypothetical protein